MARLLIFVACALVTLPSLQAQWVIQSSGTSLDIRDVVASNSQTVWAVGGPASANQGDGIILHTTDGGSNWLGQSLPGVTFARLALASSTRAFAVGQTRSRKGALVRTTDAGATWSVQDSTYVGGASSPAWLSAIFFVDSLRGWYSGSSSTTALIKRTTDGGQTWTTADTTGLWTLAPNAIFFRDTVRGWLVDEFGKVYRSTDGGASWQFNYLVNTSTGSYPLRRIAFTTADSGWAVGGLGGTQIILRTTSGGTSWIPKDSTVADGLRGLCVFDSKNIWTVGGTPARTILRSTNGGASWHAQAVPAGLSGSYLNGVSMVTTNVGWVVGSGGTILKTTNGGDTPTAVNDDSAPYGFTLDQNFPNPFNPVTIITFDLATAGPVRLAVYNTLGQEVAILFDGERAAGRGSISWEASFFPSGTYYYRLSTSDRVLTRSLLLIR